MNEQVYILIAAGAIMFAVIGGLSLLAHYYTLNGIKSRTADRKSTRLNASHTQQSRMPSSA